MAQENLSSKTGWSSWIICYLYILWKKKSGVYFFSGECSCLEGFLPHFGEEGTVSCYQEFLQGPCKDGEQYVTSDNLEFLCVPTNCEENKTRFNETCFTVPTCGSEKFVEFPSNTTSEPKCVDLVQMESGSRTGNIIGGIRTCKDGFAKNARGECQETLESGSSRPPRAQPSRYRGNVRRTCCP